MKTKQSVLGQVSLSVGLVVVMSVAAWLPGAAGAAQPMKDMHGMMQMKHITTQAQAEALEARRFHVHGLQHVQERHGSDSDLRQGARQDDDRR